jgi:hypothetical protein
VVEAEPQRLPVLEQLLLGQAHSQPKEPMPPVLHREPQPGHSPEEEPLVPPTHRQS